MKGRVSKLLILAAICSVGVWSCKKDDGKDTDGNNTGGDTTKTTGAVLIDCNNYDFRNTEVVLADRMGGDTIDYVVDCDIVVRKGLIVQPGVRIAFNAGKGLTISDEAKFLAQGTAQLPIVFTGKERAPGYWKGINVWSTNVLNEISFAEVSFAGSEDLPAVYLSAGIGVVYNCKLSVKNVLLTKNKGYGLVVVDDGELTGFASNRFVENTEAPLRLSVNQIHKLDITSSYTGNNGRDVVEIDGKILKESSEVRWPSFVDKTKYHVLNGIAVRSDVVVSPGATFEFAAGMGLRVESEAKFVAKGAAGNNIVFTGIEKKKGYWLGITIWSTNVLNQMDFVSVSYGGADELPAIYDKANLGIVYNCKLAISNSEFSNAAGYGVVVVEEGELTSFANNVFTNNDVAPIKLAANQVVKLDHISAFSGNNGRNVVEIIGSKLEENQDITWTNFADGTKYHILGNLGIKSNLKILPGAIFEIAAGKMITIDGSGGLNAVGNATSKIVFSGIEKTPGYWKGLLFWSNSVNNVLDFVDVSFGGSEDMTAIYKKTNVGIAYKSKASITNSTIADGAGYGVVVVKQGEINADVEAVNTFSNNVSGNVLIEN